MRYLAAPLGVQSRCGSPQSALSLTSQAIAFADVLLTARSVNAQAQAHDKSCNLLLTHSGPHALAPVHPAPGAADVDSRHGCQQSDVSGSFH